MSKKDFKKLAGRVGSKFKVVDPSKVVDKSVSCLSGDIISYF